MNGTPLHTPRWHRSLVRTCYTFNFFAVALAVATLGVVEWVMEAFRIEMREWVVARNDPDMLASFEEAAAHEFNVSFGILVMTVLLASLLIGTGFAMLWKSK